MLKTGPANIRYDSKRRSILNTVVKNFDYFRAQPVHLAWAMLYWNGITDVGRQHDKCHDNPKYAIIDAPLESETDKDLLYAAWGMSYAHGDLMDAPADWPLYGKQHKTLEQWVELKTHPKYPYSMLYPTADSVIDNLLLGYGTGFGWTEDGFMDEYGGGTEVGEARFYGYTRCENEVRPDLRARVLDLIQDEECRFIREHIASWVKLHTSANWPELEYHRKLARKLHYKQSVTPEESQKLRQDAYLARLLEEARNWTPQQWADAEQQEIYTFYGYPLKISEITSEHLSRASFYNLPDMEEISELLKTKPEEALMKLREENSKSGWRLIRERIERRAKSRAELEVGFTKQERHPRICEYSPITKIPHNAHPSYLNGAIKVCQRIITGPDWHPADKEVAKKILKEKFQIES